MSKPEQTQQPEENKYKRTRFQIWGRLEEIKETNNARLAKIVGDNDMVNWCFLHSETDYSDLVGLNVIASGSFYRKPINLEDIADAVGYECVFNVYRMGKQAPKKVRKPKAS